jgi:putative addiction module CopG family antidote
MRHVITADLPEDVARFAEAEVAAGRFASVEDVIHAAGVEALHRAHGSDCAAKLASLDAALEEGEQSGISEDGVFDRVRRRHGLPSAR